MPLDAKITTIAAPNAETYDLLQTPCHLIRIALKRVYDIFLEEVGGSGLTPPQFSVVLAVHQNQSIRQNDLVKLTGSDRSTVAELVGRLVARGYLTRKRLKEDQRVNRLLTTELGKEALRRAISGALAAEKRIIDPIPADKREEFIRCLKLISGARRQAGEDNPQRSAPGPQLVVRG
ncbi:MAG: MarR family winged helix-turn-helix transcriptional regulator [Alphaproteobacteria bacterium]